MKGKWKARLTSGEHMRDVAESDWKLFKKMLPQWQERYMEKLIGQYVEMLNDRHPQQNGANAGPPKADVR